jgi:hypothetical protein
MKAPISLPRIEAFGAGVFVRSRNVESRLSGKDFHRAFSEPVILWFAPGEYQEEKVGSVLDVAKKLHAIQVFRFPNASVPTEILRRIRQEYPSARVEGVKKKTPNQSLQPTAASRRG